MDHYVGGQILELHLEQLCSQPYILFWPKNVKNKNLQMNGLGAVQHSSNMQSYQHLHTVHTGCKCTTGANKQSDAIITLLPSDKVDCFRRSVVKIHFLSRKEICKNIQGHLGRLSTSYMVVGFIYILLTFRLWFG